MVYCIKCGEKNPDDSVHCSKCGERIATPKRRPITVRARSSDVCWEEEQKGVSRGAILFVGIVFIIASLLAFVAIFNPEEFTEFFENLGREMEEFFTSASFQDAAELLGPIVLMLIGLAIILGTYRSSLRSRERPRTRTSDVCWEEESRYAALFGYLVGAAFLFGGIVLAAELWYDIQAKYVSPLILAAFALVIIWYGLKMQSGD